MKYLKSFNESSSIYESIVEEIKDILLPLEDEGFLINARIMNSNISQDGPSRLRKSIKVTIKKPSSRTSYLLSHPPNDVIFNSKIFGNEFAHLSSYLNELGFDSKIGVYVSDGQTERKRLSFNSFCYKNIMLENLIEGLECSYIVFNLKK